MGFSINVRGLPIPQGSMQLRRLPNGAATGTYSPNVWAWRRLVQQAASEVMEGHETLYGPIELRVGFDLPRPANHFLPINSKRSQPEVHPKAPAHPAVAPDLDKLVRCIGDALTDAGVWKDDGQVVSLVAAKRYVTTPPGVLIQVNELAWQVKSIHNQGALL